MKKSILFLIPFALLFFGCGDNNEPFVDNDTYELNYTAEAKLASSFLTKATFGPTMDEINTLSKDNDFEAWIDNQFLMEPTYFMDWVYNNAIGVGEVDDLKDNIEDWKNNRRVIDFLQRDGWWDMSINSNDQLRQRVAFALSEIFVISEKTLKEVAEGRISYYDILIKNAFGNFETLLQDVTYHPMMGTYLTYSGNKKADEAKGTTPDENYAREVLQLFTIGLYELNTNGNHTLNNNGNKIPTYNQKDIEEMAKVFTGLIPDYSETRHSRLTYPMVEKAINHDTSDKTIMGNAIKGTDTKTEINNVLNMLFNHKNVGPFIAKRLIQRLVTSNPSPSYIEKVALAFNDNGQGVRGDMKAVIKTILLSPEAFIANNGINFGKVKEPVLFIAQALRAAKAEKGNIVVSWEGRDIYQYDSYNLQHVRTLLQNNALEAKSVFNYFTPNDGPQELKEIGLVAPETEAYSHDIHLLLMGLVTENQYYRDRKLKSKMDFSIETELIKNRKYDKLVNYLDLLFVGGQMSAETKSVITNYIKNNTNLEADTLARHSIGLTLVSPDYAVQK